MSVDLFQVYTEEERATLKGYGLSEENLTAVGEQEKLLIFMHSLFYLRKQGRAEQTDAQAVLAAVRQEFGLTKEALREVVAKYEALGVSSTSLESFFLDIPQKLLHFSTETAKTLLAGKKAIITQLCSSEYEHALDNRYLSILKSTKGCDFLAKKLSEYGLEPMMRIGLTGSFIQVTHKSMPDVYRILLEACEILEMESVPDLYVKQGFLGSCTLGDVNPLILLEMTGEPDFNRDELLFILGRELGHIKSHHQLYLMMGDALPMLSTIIGPATLGLGAMLSTGLQLAIENWKRMSEFSADRAGLLCCQNLDAALAVFMKCAGLPKAYYNITKEQKESFIEQAENFAALDESNMNKFFKYASLLGATQPWLIMRGKELLDWTKSGDYERVLRRESLHLDAQHDAPKPPIADTIEPGLEEEETKSTRVSLEKEPREESRNARPSAAAQANAAQEASAQQSQTLFCSECGSKCSKGDLFCSECGAKL